MSKAIKRTLSILLAFTLMFTQAGITAFAESGGGNAPPIGASGVCTHEHGDDCSYVEGAPCVHNHDEDCGWNEDAQTGCDHEHDGDCGYIEAVQCDHEHDEACGGFTDRRSRDANRRGNDHSL